MLHGSRVCSFHVSTVIRTANSFNKSAAKVRTVKCYNIVHKALMIFFFFFLHPHPFPSILAGDVTTAYSFSHSSYALRSKFWFFVLSFLSNNALLTLMVPYASDSALWRRWFCSRGKSHLSYGWFDKLDQGSITRELARLCVSWQLSASIPTIDCVIMFRKAPFSSV